MTVCFIFVFYYFSLFTRFSFSRGQFYLVSPVFVYFSADTLLSPTVFTSTNSFFDMSGDGVGVRIGHSRAELVSFCRFWTPELRIDRKTRKNLFHHQLWCPRFRLLDKRYHLCRNHRFGVPGAFFVSARQSTLGVGVINAHSLNQKLRSMPQFMTASLNIAWTSWRWRNAGIPMTRTLSFAGLFQIAIPYWLYLGQKVTSLLGRRPWMEMSGEVGLPSCKWIAGNLVGLSLSVSALRSRLSVLGLMSNLPALLFATSIAHNPLLTNSLMNFEDY